MEKPQDCNDFLQIRQLYAQLRREQRKIIVEYLENHGFTVKGRNGGRGICNYTSGGRFKIPYDLSNWMWIDVEKDGRKVMISLQFFDQDPHSKNYHVLMDRIGIFQFNGASSPRESYRLMKNTDIDLPMDEAKLQKLCNLLTEMLMRFSA